MPPKVTQPLPQDPHPLEPAMEALTVGNQAGHENTGALLETLIHQGEINNPEPAIEANTEQSVRNTDKIVKALAPVKDIESSTAKMAEFLSSMKGDKGDKGDTGDKGEKGDSIQGEKGDQGEQGVQGIQGIKGDKGDTGTAGNDGEDGKDGKDGRDGKDGKDGARGKDGTNADAKKEVEKIQKQIDRLSGLSSGTNLIFGRDGFTEVVHDATLSGKGTEDSPLKVVGGSGAGDMLKSVYDPNNIEADAFDYNNFINTPSLSGFALNTGTPNEVRYFDNAGNDFSDADFVRDSVTGLSSFGATLGGGQFANFEIVDGFDLKGAALQILDSINSQFAVVGAVVDSNSPNRVAAGFVWFDFITGENSNFFSGYNGTSVYAKLNVLDGGNITSGFNVTPDEIDILIGDSGTGAFVETLFDLTLPRWITSVTDGTTEIQIYAGADNFTAGDLTGLSSANMLITVEGISDLGYLGDNYGGYTYYGGLSTGSFGSGTGAVIDMLNNIYLFGNATANGTQYIEVNDGITNFPDTLSRLATGIWGNFYSYSTTAFNGTGVDDMTNSQSAYEGKFTATYVITIDGNGTPDTITWTDGTTTLNNVPIQVFDTVLSNDVVLNFGNTTGHTIGDNWTFTVAVNAGRHALFSSRLGIDYLGDVDGEGNGVLLTLNNFGDFAALNASLVLIGDQANPFLGSAITMFRGGVLRLNSGDLNAGTFSRLFLGSDGTVQLASDLITYFYSDGISLIEMHDLADVIAIDIAQRNLIDDGATISIDWDVRDLNDFNGDISLRYGTRTMQDSGATESIDWENRVGSDNVGERSFGWQDRSTYDDIGVDSIDWGNRLLINASGITTLDWDNRFLMDETGVMIMAWGRPAISIGVTGQSQTFLFGGQVVEVLVVAADTSHTLTYQDYVVEMHQATVDVTATLPATPAQGEIHIIKAKSMTSKNVIVNGNGKNIDGNSTDTIFGSLTSQPSRTYIYNNTEWSIY